MSVQVIVKPVPAFLFTERLLLSRYGLSTIYV